MFFFVVKGIFYVTILVKIRAKGNLSEKIRRRTLKKKNVGQLNFICFLPFVGGGTFSYRASRFGSIRLLTNKYRNWSDRNLAKHILCCYGARKVGLGGQAGVA